MSKIWFFLFFLLWPSNILGVSLHESVDDQILLNLGSECNSVVQLELYKEDGEISLGSGVAINDYWIVTAAHGLRNIKGIIVRTKNNTYKTNNYILHTDFDYDTAMNDIGLVKVNFPLKLNYPKISNNKIILNQKILVAGYGTKIIASKPGVELLDLKCRAGTNVVSNIEEHIVSCDMSKTNQSILECIICGGDSGGPIFDISQETLLGINSHSYALDGTVDGSYGDYGSHIDISYFVKWIEQQISEVK